MKKIELTLGQFALVDDADFDVLRRYRWWAHLQQKKYWYAVGFFNERNVSMHRFLLKAPIGVRVDHKNGNTLDNCRENLRLATAEQNAWNASAHCDSKSGIKGVFPAKGKWVAAIQASGKRLHLGTFSTVEEAAQAYNAAALRLHGDFARLNA